MDKHIETILKGKSFDFIDGFARGVWLFAWWKDGEQYCGTTGTKLKDVIADTQEMARRSLDGKGSTKIQKRPTRNRKLRV